MNIRIFLSIYISLIQLSFIINESTVLTSILPSNKTTESTNKDTSTASLITLILPPNTSEFTTHASSTTLESSTRIPLNEVKYYEKCLLNIFYNIYITYI